MSGRRRVLSLSKNLPERLCFLQIVAKPALAAASCKPEAKPEAKLTRVAFRVSRLMEFCSERELQNQTRHSVYEWPSVVAKELIDNALDACEEAEVAPEIAIVVEKDTIVVQDDTGGIDAETIESVLDYSIRVSSREAYVSPTRGAQGIALKTILAMGYVLDRGTQRPNQRRLRRHDRDEARRIRARKSGSRRRAPGQRLSRLPPQRRLKGEVRRNGQRRSTPEPPRSKFQRT
jgi:Histidine kinase-, DNA gyrase B-, and HSP90-like ATPase